ncbi:hypothetical protein OIU84_008673 [Salix udensis]|uniref:Uncharacterized protein n=1 Tax=Salix udensis TaxID=889485 RepID=A0AAD6JR49_9ROSI|nr:hypothetical protein OIU84_008673 [Salix udensis]
MGGGHFITGSACYAGNAWQGVTLPCMNNMGARYSWSHSILLFDSGGEAKMLKKMSKPYSFRWFPETERAWAFGIAMAELQL